MLTCADLQSMLVDPDSKGEEVEVDDEEPLETEGESTGLEAMFAQVRIGVCACACVCVSEHALVCVCLCVCAYVCMHLYVRAHIYHVCLPSYFILKIVQLTIDLWCMDIIQHWSKVTSRMYAKHNWSNCCNNSLQTDFISR